MSNRSINVQLEELLKSMQGKTYLHMAMRQVLESWRYEGDQCYVETSWKMFTGTPTEIYKRLTEDFMECEPEDSNDNAELTLKEGEMAIQRTIQAMPVTATHAVCSDMMQGLLAAFNKVSEDKDFKSQADTMTGIAGRAIDFYKAELDAVRIGRDIIRNR